jgi:hypothetical protein
MIAALLFFNSTHKKSIEIFYLLVVLDSEIATSKWINAHRFQHLKENKFLPSTEFIVDSYRRRTIRNGTHKSNEFKSKL